MAAVKRKMWILIFGKYEFAGIIKVAKKFNLEVLTAFKPDMMVDVHLGVKGEKNNVEAFKKHLLDNKHEVRNRCPRRSFQFEI